MYQNVIIGNPLLVPAWELFADSESDWIANESQQTLLTETRLLSKVLVEAGLAPSIGEVRRNQPKMHVLLNKPDFFVVKWGKKYLNVAVAPAVPEDQWGGEPEFIGVTIPSPRPQKTTKERVLDLLHSDGLFVVVQTIDNCTMVGSLSARETRDVIANFPSQHVNDEAFVNIYYNDTRILSYRAGDPKWKIEIQ